MCYHYDAAGNKKALKRFTFLKESPDYKPIENANAFSFPKMPVVTNNNTHQIQLFEWGLIPHWADADRANELKKSTLNAKSETIFELASFKDCTTKRCLVLAESFYEWRTEGKRKIPYQIFVKDQEVFAMGGIFNEWKNIKTGETKNTFSIITVPANDMMAYIHNTKQRMPLILPINQELDWLKPNLNQAQITAMMRPYKSSEMKANQIRHEGEQYTLF
jgi:putative SOS response-associated peptidase YedK